MDFLSWLGVWWLVGTFHGNVPPDFFLSFLLLAFFSRGCLGDIFLFLSFSLCRRRIFGSVRIFVSKLATRNERASGEAKGKIGSETYVKIDMETRERGKEREERERDSGREREKKEEKEKKNE